MPRSWQIDACGSIPVVGEKPANTRLRFHDAEAYTCSAGVDGEGLVSLDGVGGSSGTVEVRAASAVSRAAAVSATQATQPRFDLLDPALVGGRPTSSRTRTGDATEQKSSSNRSSGGDGADNQGKSAKAAPYTAFLAQSLAQSDSDAGASTSSVRTAGLSAYARSTGGNPAATPGVEVLSPSLPPLSSGRALDLAV